MSEEINSEENQDNQDNQNSEDPKEIAVPVSGLYKEYFLDYASYVILERAVPAIEDGLKPVQRRILHSMNELEDGRYNKVANVIGNTMKYHPHGDAAIGDAMVQMGQKDLLIDTQGNWGNILTGDRSAAPRYIESRLSKFALEVLFNRKTTTWQLSYDGRNKEPITLPVKFPLLLAHGVEGIAVGLACKILPHNFNELIDASIKYLQGKSFKLYPDFPTGGMADVSAYNHGIRGGRVRVRAKLHQKDNNTLIITEIPFGTTTSSLIESIIRANDKGKIKVKKIEDNTAENVEILIHLHNNVSPDQMVDALYAFTDCETSISPNSCVIEDDTPVFLEVEEMLKRSADATVELLKLELEIKKAELQEQWHFASLEKIFIENRIYRDIEECETWEDIISTIRKGLKPHIKHLLREVTDEDIGRLTEIKIKRITKFDSNKADDHILALEGQLEEVNANLAAIIPYSIEYFKTLKKKYGKGKERKTELKSFDTISRATVAVANVKLYVDKNEGFIGYGLKKSASDFVCDCSDIDDIIVIREDGVMTVTKIASKNFVGKNILHADVWNRGDDRTIYNMIYRDGKDGKIMMKRFAVTSITRDKEYNLTKGKPGSKVLYLTVNPNGEAETITVFLKPRPKLKKLKLEVDFAELAIKGRGAGGNIVTKYPVKKIEQKEKGVSTLGARKIWFDKSVRRLNTEERGEYLGEFGATDKVLAIMKSGHYKLSNFDVTNFFDEDLIIIEKWNPQKPISVIYWDNEKMQYFIKRFLVEDTDKITQFISDSEGSYLEFVSVDWQPKIKLNFAKVKGKERDPEEILVHEFISVKGLKARGNRLSPYKVKKIEELEPLPYQQPESSNIDEEEDEPKEPSTEKNKEQPNPEDKPKQSTGKAVRESDDDEENQITLFD